MDIMDLVRAWHRAGSVIPANRLGLYAQALVAHRQIGPYRSLTDEQEDRAILALYRVDRPRATFEDIRQAPALALSSYYQLLHDLAREGLGPHEPEPAQVPASKSTLATRDAT
jgi:hypothetical protein